MHTHKHLYIPTRYIHIHPHDANLFHQVRMGTKQITDTVNPSFFHSTHPSVFLIFVSQASLRCHSLTLSKQEPDHLPSCLLPSKCDVSAVRQAEGERVTLIAASPRWRNYLLPLTSLPPSLHLSPSLRLSSVAPSLLSRSNII